MRILVATHNYPRFMGDPAGAFVARIAAGVRAVGHDVRVVAPHAPGVPRRETTDGVEVARFRYLPERWERVAYRGDLHRQSVASSLVALGVPAFLLGFGRALRRAVREFRPDVIHAHWWLPAGWLAGGLGAPLVITSHGSDVRMLDRSALVRSLARRAFARASVVTTVSDFLGRSLAAALPEAAPKLRTVYMPVDLAHFARGAEVAKAAPPRVLYAGNLNPSKGVDVLLDAAARLAGRGVDFRLRVLGQGPSRADLEARAAALGLASRVEWSDFVTQREMPAEYGASTVTVLPTRGQAEGLGLTLVEALLAGSAVVGSPAGGIPEVVIDGETGLIAPDGDAATLAACIERLLSDPELRARLVANGQTRARALFAPEAAVANFLAAYDDAVRHQR